jgi:hypothetical protein
MTIVFGPLDSLKKDIEEVVTDFKKSNAVDLRVVINDSSSIQKTIERKPRSLPRDVMYASEEKEIAVQEKMRIPFVQRYKTVIALVFPYGTISRSGECVVVADDRYNDLGAKIKERISALERGVLVIQD